MTVGRRNSPNDAQSRRSILTSAGVLPLAGVLGCVGRGTSAAQRRAVDAYERALGNHVRGLESLDRGFEQYADDRIDEAISAFDAGREAFDEAQTELQAARSAALEDGSVDATAVLDTAARRVARGWGIAKEAADGAEEIADERTPAAERAVENARDRYRESDLQLPPVDRFEDAF